MTRLTTSFRRAGRLDHALRAVLALDGTAADHPCKLSDLVERSPAPGRFLATILGALGQAGIVGSARGSRGGYWLTRGLDEITVLAIVEAVGPIDPIDEVQAAAGAANGEGPATANEATAGNGAAEDPGPDPATGRRDQRSVEQLWRTVDDHIRVLLGTLTMADLARSDPALEHPVTADAP